MRRLSALGPIRVMDRAIRKLVEQIHATGRQFVLAITGGGSAAISELLTVPGGSRTLLEAVVPYSASAVDDWLSATPDHYCSERTARAMAMVAFERARKLAPGADQRALVGIGCSASLTSDRAKRGPHRVHVSWQTAERTAVGSLELKKGARDRVEEEQVAAAMVLDAMAAFSAQGTTVTSGLWTKYALAGERLQQRSQAAPTSWTELLLGNRCVAYFGSTDPENRGREIQSQGPQDHPSGKTPQCVPTTAPGPFGPQILLPGAFNPLHNGHRRMAQIGKDRAAGAPVWFELSMTNVDKPPLDFIEIADRIASLDGLPFVVTRSASFKRKALLFPGAVFIVGADTIQRIADPRYYAGDPARVAAAIQVIASQSCRFLVFGRTMRGQFMGLGDLDLPGDLRDLCEGVSEAEFCEDVSSTELREKTGGRSTGPPPFSA